MFGSSQKSVEQKPLKDANFLSIYVDVYKCVFVRICLHASGSRCAKTEPSSYGSCETKNKRCGSCILTTKRVTQTNYYDIFENYIYFIALPPVQCCQDKKFVLVGFSIQF
jgi:hypothetical protein